MLNKEKLELNVYKGYAGNKITVKGSGDSDVGLFTVHYYHFPAVSAKDKVEAVAAFKSILPIGINIRSVRNALHLGHDYDVEQWMARQQFNAGSGVGAGLAVSEDAVVAFQVTRMPEQNLIGDGNLVTRSRTLATLANDGVITVVTIGTNPEAQNWLTSLSKEDLSSAV